jgi:predicted PurR-regulated permease PerM
MAATTITKDGEIPGFPAARRQEREFVSLTEIRLNLKQVFITIATVGAFLIGVGLGIGRLNAVEDRINAFEKSTNERIDKLEKSIDTRFDKVDTRFDRIETTLESIRKELHKGN